MKIGNSGAVTSLVRRKAVFWSHLYIKTPSFYQDRLGTNIIGKSQKADRFLTSSLVKKKRKKGQSAAGAAAVDWASEAHPIGEFEYQTFTSGDFNIFLKDFGSRIGMENGPLFFRVATSRSKTRAFAKTGSGQT
jgi:hypothetical protein